MVIPSLVRKSSLHTMYFVLYTVPDCFPVQLLSYGGLLSYITFYAEDGSGLSNPEAQVLMRGGTLEKHTIYTDKVAAKNGIRSQHNIRLTEVQKHRKQVF